MPVKCQLCSLVDTDDLIHPLGFIWINTHPHKQWRNKGSFTYNRTIIHWLSRVTIEGNRSPPSFQIFVKFVLLLKINVDLKWLNYYFGSILNQLFGFGKMKHETQAVTAWVNTKFTNKYSKIFIVNKDTDFSEEFMFLTVGSALKN